MKKTVGIFNGVVSPPAPCWCSIEVTDRTEWTIRFSHEDLLDLKHLVEQMIRDVESKNIKVI